MISSSLKNLLHVLRYPALPMQTDLVGEFRVGAIQTRIPGATACQIHYPTLESSSSIDAPYFRPEAAKGLADYTRQSPALMEFLSMRKHPCYMGALPIPGRQFPVVVFSHGLGGCMEMYTELCQQIASMGYWVIALEHEDGSGAYAYDAETDTPILYKRPDDTPYSRNKVLSFRAPFLEQRVEEITSVVNFVMSDNHSTDDNNDATKTQQVWQAADKTSGIHLLGHSFGGASMVLASQSEKLISRHSINSVGLLDCWAFSLSDSVLDRGCGSFPTLSILSEAWLSNPETAQVEQLLQNTPNLSSFYCPDSMHTSFSDAANWLPRVVARSMYMRAPREKRHATIRTVAKACVQHMQNDTNDSKKDALFEGLKEYEVQTATSHASEVAA